MPKRRKLSSLSIANTSSPPKPAPKRSRLKFTAIPGPRKDQQNCSLLALPRELRDMIYGSVFKNTEVELSDRPEYNRIAGKAPGILLSCRQIHHEALKIYYLNLTILTISSRSRSLYGRAPLDLYLARIGSLRESLIPRIRLIDMSLHLHDKQTDRKDRRKAIDCDQALCEMWKRTNKRKKCFEVLVKFGKGVERWTANPCEDVQVWERFVAREGKGVEEGGEWVREAWEKF